MRFYTQQHSFYCGIDLHARTMYVCILSREGEPVIQGNIPTPDHHARALSEPFSSGCPCRNFLVWLDLSRTVSLGISFTSSRHLL